MLSLYSSLSSARSGLRSIVKSGLQLFYKVNVTSGSVLDRSRNSNNGTVYSGKALDFDGTDDLVELNDANLTGEFTVCTWIKPDTFTNCVVFGDGRDENNNYLNLNWIRLQSATSITVKIAGNSTGYAPITHGGNIAQDEWSRLIVTRGSDNIVRFGINGTLYSPSTTTIAGTFNFNLLGRKQGTEMEGALADVQVYDKAWTASDVEFDYNNPDKDLFDNPNSSIVVTDCKSLLRLNEGAGDRVYDAAPVLREELSDLSWVANGDWSIDGDIASNDGGGSTLTNDILELGKTYQFKCKLSSYTSGEFSLYLGVSNQSSRFSGTNEFTFIGVCAGDTVARVKAYSGDGSLSISSLTIKEIKPSESFSIIGDKNFVHQQPYIPQYAMSSFSKKMVFDGVNDYVTGSFNGNIGPAKDITLSCWFSYEDSVAASGDRETLFGLLSSSSDGFPARKFEVGLFETNRIVVYTGDGTTATSSSTLSDVSSPLSNNKLNHVAVSLSSSGVVKIYVNGVESATATHSNFGAPTITHYRIGSRTNTSLLNKGIIDEVSLFDVELTQTEVLELFNSGSAYDSTTHSQSSNLNAYWRNNGAAQWDDLSTNTNHGTVSGSPAEIFLQEVPFFGKDSLGMFMNKPRLGGLNFNNSGYVNTGSPFQSTFRDSFSICFWFKFPDGQPSSAIRFFGHDVGEDELFISLETDGKSKTQFRSNNDRVISKTDAAIASNNQTDWIYLTVTVTKASTIGDAQIIFYKDGSAVDSSLVGSETLTQANMEAYTQTQNIVLGAFNNDGTIANFCDGIIDDFKIYSKALTAAEVSKNYKEGKGRHKN